MKSVFVSALSLLSNTIHGWSTGGHHAVAAIAHQFMKKSTAIWVRSHLGGQTALDAMYEASVWADSELADAGTKEYHFVHTPYRTCSPYDETRDCGINKSGKCLVTGIAKYVEDMLNESSSTQDVAIAIKMLIHLLADLHQPLHLSFAKDLGGNLIELSSPITNSLHELWDWYLVDDSLRAEILRMGNAELISMSGLSLEGSTIDLEDNAAVHDWVAELVSRMSSQYTCPKAYRDSDGNWIETGHSLESRYLADRRAIVRELLVQAGMRLAFIFNRASQVWEKRVVKSNVVAVVEKKVPLDSNPFSCFSIDDIDLNTLADEVQSEESPSGGADAESVVPPPQPFMYGDVDISSVRLLAYEGGYYVTRSDELITGARRAEIVTAVSACTVYQVTFGMNGKTVFVFFDTNAFPESLLRDVDFVKALLYRVKGRRVDQKKISISSPAGQARQLTPYSGLLPSFLVLNPDHQVDGATQVRNSLFHTRLHPDRRTVEMSPADAMRILTRNKIVTAKFEAIPLQEGLAEFYKQDIVKKCASIAVFETDGLSFATTIKALENSVANPGSRDPIRAHEYISFGDNKLVTSLVDVNLIPMLLTTELDQIVAQCTRKHGRDAAIKAFRHRPTIFDELTEIMGVIDALAHGKEPPHPKFVRTIMAFPSPFVDGSIIIEWNRNRVK